MTQISYEIFPPKTINAANQLQNNLANFCADTPAFISVTCGAFGTAQTNNLAICDTIHNTLKTPCVAHVTCIGASKKSILQRLQQYQEIGINTVLALRGDIPENQTLDAQELHQANQLIELIQNDFANTHIYVAGYPEGHPGCADIDQDFYFQLEKAKQGTNGIITQLFFDNACFIEYQQRMRKHGYQGKIIAGIFLITNAKQILKISELCKVYIPTELRSAITKYQDDPIALCDYGIEYAAKQIDNLQKHGCSDFHIYTMNRSDHVTKLRKLLN